jgi:nucleoside-diphosphate-sugar epimerase
VQDLLVHGLLKKALAADYEVVGIDNLASKVNYTPLGVEFHELDLVNDNISEFVKDVNVVIHAASYAEIRHNWENRSERKRLFDNNEMATINFLEQIPDVPIIYLSSASILWLIIKR